MNNKKENKDQEEMLHCIVKNELSLSNEFLRFHRTIDVVWKNLWVSWINSHTIDLPFCVCVYQGNYGRSRYSFVKRIDHWNFNWSYLNKYGDFRERARAIINDRQCFEQIQLPRLQRSSLPNNHKKKSSKICDPLLPLECCHSLSLNKIDRVNLEKLIQAEVTYSHWQISISLLHRIFPRISFRMIHNFDHPLIRISLYRQQIIYSKNHRCRRWW